MFKLETMRFVVTDNDNKMNQICKVCVIKKQFVQ